MKFYSFPGPEVSTTITVDDEVITLSLEQVIVEIIPTSTKGNYDLDGV